MLAKNLKRAIEKRGGTATITVRPLTRWACQCSSDWQRCRSEERCAGCGAVRTEERELSGSLGNSDVHMFLGDDGGSSYFTVREVSRRGEHDPFSDYNPGGYTFCNRLRDLDWAVR